MRLRQQLRGREIQGAGDALQRIQRHHALAALNLPDVGQAEPGAEREFLLREVSIMALSANRGPELSLESGCGIWHRGRLSQKCGASLPTIVIIHEDG
jgi:hypothetical protein